MWGLMKPPTSLLLALLPTILFAAPASLTIDPAQSRIEVIVPCTMDSFIGTLDTYAANITVDGVRVTGATLGFNFTDVHTGKPARDGAMNEWQGTAQNPKCAFVMSSLEPIGGSVSRFNAHGTLNLHGVTTEIAFPVSVTTDQQLYAIDGEAPLDTRNFGLPVIRKFGLLKVDPLIKVRFHLQGVVNASAVNTSAAVPVRATSSVTAP